MKRKRLLTLLLSVLMVLALAPAVPNVSYAATMTEVNVSTMDELNSYLSSANNYDITVTKDLEVLKNGTYSIWCTIHGTKALNLNGHSILLRNDTKVNSSTMFNIATDGDLVIYDTADSSKSTIRYNAYIDDDGTFQERHIFDVYGKMTMNGGTVEAGRSKSFWSTKHAVTTWKQTFGNGIRVRSGGILTVNKGTIYGRGSYLSQYYGIIAMKESNVYFNNGSVYAKGGADCFLIVDGANVRVALGTFTCDTLTAVKIDGNITFGPSKGKVGLGKAALSPQTQKHTTNSLEKVSDLTLYPTSTTEVVKGKSGSTSGNSICLLSTNPVLYTTNVTDTNPVFGYNFRNVDTNSRGISYGIWYRWMLWEDGSTKLADTGCVLSKKEINVMNDFSGVTLEKGKTYYLRAYYEERLLDAKFVGSNTSISFTVQDDLAAPVITKDLPSSITATAGQSVTFSVSAAGTNLKYSWQLYNPSLRKWGIVMDQSGSSLYLHSVTTDMDGRIYKCVVSNSAGTAISQTCKLIVSEKTITLSRIDLFDLDQPVMGQPLDFTATATTDGVTVTSVEWGILAGDKITNGIAPAAGMKVDAHLNLHLADGYSFANPCTSYLDGEKQLSAEANTATDKKVSFSFTVAAPEGGAVIDSAHLDFEHGNEPAVGKTPEYVVVREIKEYDDAYSRDVRYTDSDNKWFREDGSVMPFSETFQAGKSYTVQTTLKPNSEYGWEFTSSSTAELNGEPMDVKLDGNNLIVRKTYSLADDTTSEPGGSPFEDIYESDEYYNAVLWAYYATPQITNGMDETHFGPHFTVTRAQAVTFLWRSQGCPEPGSTVNPFVDVPSTEYYYKPVLWAVENGITKGVDDTHFNPMDTLSTLHMITFLYRTKNPGMDGWNGEAAAWAADSSGRPFGVDIAVNNTTPCPRCNVVRFLYEMSH